MHQLWVVMAVRNSLRWVKTLEVGGEEEEKENVEWKINGGDWKEMQGERQGEERETETINGRKRRGKSWLQGGKESIEGNVSS